MASKILWSEGTFIRPQHFQQQEKYLLTEFHNRIESVQSYYWGFRKLKINHSDLDIGQFSIDECAGSFQDGTTFVSPTQDALPLSIKVPDATRDAIVYLALPARRASAAEVGAVDEVGSLIRYLPSTNDYKDITSETGKTSTIDIAELRCRLFIEDQINQDDAQQVPDGYLKLAVAHIDEVVGGRIKLRENFIPVCQLLSASTVLVQFLTEFQSMLGARADELARRVSGAGGSGGVSEVADFLLLQTINRIEPKIEQLIKLKAIHPMELYLELLSFASELSTFMRVEKRPQPQPLYSHDDLTRCFTAVTNEITQSFSVVLEQIATSIPLSPPKSNIRAARLTNMSLIENGYMVLAVSAQVPQDTLVREFPAQVKIAPGEKIFQLVQSALPGIPLTLMATAPREIPIHAGFCYFELGRQSPLWQELHHSKGMAIHVSDNNFPGLEMQLWTINRK